MFNLLNHFRSHSSQSKAAFRFMCIQAWKCFSCHHQTLSMQNMDQTSPHAALYAKACMNFLCLSYNRKHWIWPESPHSISILVREFIDSPFLYLLPAYFSSPTCMRMPTQSSCARHLFWLSGQACMSGVCACKNSLYACVSVGSSLFQLVGGRAEQDQLAGCTGHRGAPPDPWPAGGLGWRWHSHKSTDTEHVEAFRKQTHHLLPAGTPPLSLPSSTTVAFLSSQVQIVPMEIVRNTAFVKWKIKKKNNKKTHSSDFLRFHFLATVYAFVVYTHIYVL